MQLPSQLTISFFALKFCCDFFPVVLVSCYRVGIVILIALVVVVVVVVSFVFMSFDETCGQKTGKKCSRDKA